MVWRPDYATTAELKSYLRIGDTSDDAELALAVTSASRAVDTATGRQFGSVTLEERTYVPEWDRRRSLYVVAIDDLMDSTGLVVETAGDTVAAADYTLLPRNAEVLGRPWVMLTLATAGEDVDVTASWGWTAVPDTIKQATLLQASRFFKRRESPFGVAGSPELGSELRLLNKVDPDVDLMLGAYRRWWAA